MIKTQIKIIGQAGASSERVRTSATAGKNITIFHPVVVVVKLHALNYDNYLNAVRLRPVLLLLQGGFLAQKYFGNSSKGSPRMRAVYTCGDHGGNHGQKQAAGVYL